MVDQTTGYGQQDPNDSAGEFNAQSFLIQQAIARISTMKPVKVMAVDSTAKTVDVQPMVNQVDGQNNATPHGSIFGVPYVTWQFGINALLADPVVGDRGIMVVSDRDMSAVKATRDIAPPGSFRKLDAADGVYLGGILNDAPEQWVKFNDDGMELHDTNGNSIVSGPMGWEFTGQVTFNQAVVANTTIDVKGATTLEAGVRLGGSIEDVAGGLYGGNIHTSGTIQGDHNVIGAGISVKDHRHSGVQTGGGDTGPPF